MDRTPLDEPWNVVFPVIGFALAIGVTAMTFPGDASAVVTCPSNGSKLLPEGGAGQDLEVTGTCTVGAGDYAYGNVNVFGTADRPAVLRFKDARITFSARSILVENYGYLLAGWSSQMNKPRPIGTKQSGLLTIRLYGAPGDPPIACKSGPTCGVDSAIWSSNADPTKPPVETPSLPGGRDYFYNYDFMPFAEGQPTTSYFGSKVLAVSYGGTLRMFGKRGALYGDRDDDPADSGRSWVRLEGSLAPDARELRVDGVVDWREGDHIVVTTTDYLPGHSEELIITGTSVNLGNKTTKIEFTKATCPPDGPPCGVKWWHHGEQYPLTTARHPGIGRLDLNIKSVDTRAAVALLSRSIRIVSAGDTPDAAFPAASTRYMHGGHTLVRQGFKAYQMQGVELHQLGQGGRIGHYPVHFHMVRNTPNNTFVKDASIHDSMSRWITLHATQGVLLARNVGYMSIGHGYYIEDGTETDNKLYSNIGILARAAVDYPQNPRKIPGILSARFTDRQHNFPYHSDAEQPTVFWIMNGWNDFRYNFAAGAGGCGSCYWLVPGYNSGRENTRLCYNPTTARYSTPCQVDADCTGDQRPPGFTCAPYSRMTWKGYAAMQSNLGRAGTTPLMKFVGNSCTSAMNSFPTVGELGTCNGVAPLTRPDDKEHLVPIENPLAPAVQGIDQDLYYPRVVAGSARPATRCGDDPKKVADLDCGNDAMFLKCASNPSPPLPPPANRPITNCMVTVLDRYTTSFNWADTNFAAVWLRQFWYVFSNSAITDVQNGGLTFVTGGDYTRASVIDGFWSVAAKSAFVGRTQPDVTKDPTANPYASAAGPFNPQSKLECPINDATLQGALPNHCIAPDDGANFEVANFATNQRLFSIYDGPSYQDSNAYLDIEPTKLPELSTQCQRSGSDACPGALKLYGRKGGVPKDATSTCYLPNAAIGWKQPNGFFYPPAFHSRNLYFNNAQIRHFVIQPEFSPGTLVTDPARVAARYCTYPIVQDQAFGLFNGYTDVDRQTVLNDDDGSLTGLVAKPPGGDKDAERETISVNFDTYFNAPIEAVECGSDVANPPTGFPPGTAKTSPYEYLTTAVYPACARLGGPQPAGSEPACGYRVTPPDPVTPEPVQNPNWWSDCTNPNCYGVPLYRQGLNSTERRDGTQAIRMMGANLWQRSTLTANNGVYYLDTTAGAGKQAASPNKNIFEPNRTYYLVFIYATPSTHQVYQMYLKPGLPTDYADRNVFLTRVFPNVSHFDFRDNLQLWPEGWVRAYDPATGILTVTIDMGFATFRNEFEQARKDFCQPPSFCKLDGNRCRCNEDGDFVNICKDNDICGRWAGKDIDWPDGGAYGFGVRFPDGFVADDQDHRPAPPPGGCIRQTDRGWDVPLAHTKDKLLGACKDTPITPPQFCAP